MESRIARLESMNRRLIVAVGLLSACVVGFVAMGAQNQTKSVRAQQFVLVDESGVMRGMFGMLKGEPTLKLLSSDKKGAISMEVIEGDVSLMLYGDKKTVASVAAIGGTGVMEVNGGTRSARMESDPTGITGFLVTQGGDKEAVIWKAP